jgi:hypothetical protein
MRGGSRALLEAVRDEWLQRARPGTQPRTSKPFCLNHSPLKAIRHFAANV